MKKDKKYVFRDHEELLEKLESGTRSEFIREAIKLKIKLSKKTYNIKTEETNEIIKFYENRIKKYDEELEQLTKEQDNIRKQKNNMINKLEKAKQEQTNRKIILEQQNKLENRENIIEYIISNTLRKRQDKKINPLNMDYLVEKGSYENILELKNDIINHINNLEEYDTINDQKIFKNDIEYLKNNINRSQ